MRRSVKEITEEIARKGKTKKLATELRRAKNAQSARESRERKEKRIKELEDEDNELRAKLTRCVCSLDFNTHLAVVGEAIQ